jgi:hypothetical protein
MSDHLIPGPDPGACPDCGGWRKAGMFHSCEDEFRRRERWAKAATEMVNLFHETVSAHDDARNGALKFGNIKYMYRSALWDVAMMLNGSKEGDPQSCIDEVLKEGERLETEYWAERRERMSDGLHASL